MAFSAENILLVGSVLIFVSIIISKTGYRFGIPTLLMFLIVGMLFGSDGLGLQFNNAHEAQFIGTIALSIILFTGGMDTKFSEIRPVIVPGLLLSTVGVVVTTLLTGAFIYFITGWDKAIDMSLATSILLAATMSSTDSASVFNLLRSQRMNLKDNLRPMLELESGSNDPMAYMLTIVMLQIITAGEINAATIAKEIALQFLFGGCIGYAMGKAAVKLLQKIDLPNPSLYPILLLSMVIFTFTMTDAIDGNGYLAVYLMGIIVGNERIVNKREVSTFMEGLTWLFQIVMFIILGLLVNPHEMLPITGIGLLIAVFMILVARPASVLVCLLPFRKMKKTSKLFISWVGLRGATPIIFATYPVIEGIDGSDYIFNIVFFITLLSLLIQGTTISSFARKLHLDLPEEPKGNEFGVEITEDVGSSLNEITLTKAMLANGNKLKDMNLPKGCLVMMVKRGNEFIIPNGQVELYEGDKLLIISEEKRDGQTHPGQPCDELKHR